MGLASALSTALTGMSAAETTIDVVGNNLANANTVGFKASQASFATQFLQTQGLGSAPGEGSGGTNPRQIGLGTMVTEITPNFSQGTIQISSSPTDLAIQGDGFFIVQGTSGEQVYTRNGQFKLNSESELTTITGNRLLGYGVDNNFQIQTTTLTPLTIPLGATEVAKATQSVYLEGTLTPTGDLADAAQSIATGILGDGQYSRPVAAVGTEAATGPSLTGMTPTPYNGPGSVDNGTYWYKIVYADGTYGTLNATEGVASTAFQVTVDGAAGEDTVRFDNLAANEHYATARIYRTAVNGAVGDDYYFVGEASTNYFRAQDVTAQGLTSPTGNMVAGTYYYRFEYATAAVPGGTTGAVSKAASAVRVDLASGQNAAQLTNVPTDPAYQYVRVYRSQAVPNGSSDPESLQYFYDGELDTATGTTYIDKTADAGLGGVLTHYVNIQDTMSNATALTKPKLDQTATIDGQYQYYVTFYNSGTGRESRPNPLSATTTVQPGVIHLFNIPTPDVAEWDRVRIYRNTATETNTFRMVTELTDLSGNASYTDKMSDAILRTKSVIDLEGPKIEESTKLKDILRRDGSNYNRVFDFQAGTTATLNFTGKKGGRTLSMKSFTIDDTTTIAQLNNFMEQALGIQRRPGPDSAHPIPIDANTGQDPRGYVVDGRILVVGNNGADNAVDVGLSGMQLVTTTGTSTVNMPFSVEHRARGQSAVADLIAYDSLGIPLSVRLTAVLESRSSTSTVYRWYADSRDNDPVTGAQIAVGTGLISFDGDGNFISATEGTVSISRSHVSSTSPLEFELNFDQLSGLAASKSSLAATRQDGSAPGTLTSFVVGEDGLIRGVFSNGVTRSLGQIRLARFSNPLGLEQKGENLYGAGINSGLPIEGNPNDRGIGSIVAGAQELSNTDVGANLIDLILASTMYRGNTRVVTTVQQMLDELLALRR